MESVDVVVASYGSIDVWEPFIDRAMASATSQTHPANAVWQLHDPVGSDLSVTRNECAAASTADWLIFLDADDELDRNYVDAMLSGDGSGSGRLQSTVAVTSDAVSGGSGWHHCAGATGSGTVCPVGATRSSIV